jgi:MFS family permease
MLMPESGAATLPARPAGPPGLKAKVLQWVRRFSADFWRFFAAAFFFDFGFGLFFFLFNLYLTDLHFNERIIGQIVAALTLGNVAGTIPAMIAVRRFGLQKPLLFSFIAAPLICSARVFALWPAAQLSLAFLTGLALCCWPICFSPTVAKLTDEQNRASGFSIVFATGIGMGALAGVAGGYLPRVLQSHSAQGSLIGGMRIVLLLSCGVILLGVWPLRKLADRQHATSRTRSIRFFHPFLLRFLPPFMLWNVVAGSFTTFGAIYLMKIVGLPLGRVGAVFSASQLLQFSAVLATPILYRRFGTARGVAMAQTATAVFLLLICSTKGVVPSVLYFLAFNGAQWMCSPGIYRYLMDHIPEQERGTASAVQNLSGALCQAATAAITGSCIVHFGYSAVMAGNAVFALMAAALFFMMPRWTKRGPALQMAHEPCADASE